MKISIIIPTRERAMYLGASIRTALNIEDDNIEVIVSDNASDDNTREIVEAETDPRLIYLPSDRRMSMRENFNRSLNASSGDYVIFIGDDDSILSNQFQFLRRILDEQTPDGISWVKATYGWPVQNSGPKSGGIRFYRQETYGKPFSYDPQNDIDTLLNCKLAQLNPAPNIYHGCVSRKYLDRIAPEPNIYFDSVIPDVNFQYRCNFVGGKFLHSHHQFSINGYSPASNGGSQVTSKPGTLGEKIAKQFEAENRTDSYDDIIDHATTIQMVYFATLETLRERGGFSNKAPNLTEWYHFAINAGRQKPEKKTRIEKALNDYADRTGTQKQLAAARTLPPKPKRTLTERIKRARGQISSFRLSAEKDGVNTVLTATQIYDAILGQEYGAVLDGTISSADAWRAAKRRSKKFTRQL